MRHVIFIQVQVFRQCANVFSVLYNNLFVFCFSFVVEKDVWWNRSMRIFSKVSPLISTRLTSKYMWFGGVCSVLPKIGHPRSCSTWNSCQDPFKNKNKSPDFLFQNHEQTDRLIIYYQNLSHYDRWRVHMCEGTTYIFLSVKAKSRSCETNNIQNELMVHRRNRFEIYFRLNPDLY